MLQLQPASTFSGTLLIIIEVKSMGQFNTTGPFKLNYIPAVSFINFEADSLSLLSEEYSACEGVYCSIFTWFLWIRICCGQTQS